MSKIFKKITLILILTICTLGMFSFANVANAVEDTVVETQVRKKKFFKLFGENMPERDFGPTAENDGTGLMPQFLKKNINQDESTLKRTVTLAGERNLLETTTWDVDVNGEIVFCARKGGWVRYGKYDPGKKYLNKNGITIQGEHVDISGIEESQIIRYINIGTTTVTDDKIISKCEAKAISESKKNNEEFIEIVGDITKHVEWVGNAGQNNALSVRDRDSEGIEITLNIGRYEDDLRTEVMRAIGQDAQSVYIENFDESTQDLDSEYTSDDSKVIASVMVLEQNDHTPGYAEKGSGTFGTTDSTTYENLAQWYSAKLESGTDEKAIRAEIEKAYIFTAAENVYNYKDGTCAFKYNLNDIQSAFWHILKEHEDGKDPSGSITNNGTKLFKSAEDFADFVEKMHENDDQYVATINKDNAKVIVNKENQTYVIGPVSIEYPYCSDMSYIKALTIETDNGIKLIYSDSNEDGKYSDFEIVSNKYATMGSNGTEKQYPKSGSDFFIIIKADKIEGAKKLNIGAKFEYLSLAQIKYTYLETEANIYNYVYNDGDYVQIDVYYSFDYKVEVETENIGYSEFEHKDGCPYASTKYLNNEKACTCTPTHTADCEKFGNCEGTTKACKSNGHDHSACLAWHNGNPGSYSKDPTKCRCGGQHQDTCAKWSNYSVQNCPYCKGEGKEYNYKTISWPTRHYEKLEEINIAGIYKQPYIEMTDTHVKKSEAQKLMITGDGKRTYVTKDINIDEWIDITIDLGGYVWLDGEHGKEDEYDGICDGETKIPDVKVYLYEKGTYGFSLCKQKDNNSEEIKNPTETDEDGKYEFKDLDAMKDYIIRFEYNGQYYEPTTDTPANDPDNGWGKEKWKYNSNADELARENFNKKFEIINSSPKNYTGSNSNTQVFTRKQLEEDEIIDEYGNIKVDNDSPESLYAKDCLISSYTDLYPYPSIFIIDEEKDTKKLKVINSNSEQFGMTLYDIETLYDSANYINLGLHPRREAMIALKTDIDNVQVVINREATEYKYNKREQAGKDYWDISVRLEDEYYKTDYSRDIYREDYLYKVSSYGNPETYGKTKEDELEVYITYKIMVRNQSASIDAQINEIVDYYDEDLEYIGYCIKDNTTILKTSDSSMCGGETQMNIQGYNNLYIQDIGRLGAGEQANIYLTFRVRKDVRNNENWLKLDEQYLTGEPIGVGKENIAEINSYSTYYSDGTNLPNRGNVSGKPAGLVDVNSTPGNLEAEIVPKDGTIKFEKFENDTDKAPNIRIILNRESARTITGSVWEDIRTLEKYSAMIGDGIKDQYEPLINGVTVQLIEIMENGTEFLWKQFENGTGMTQTTTPVISAEGLIPNYNLPSNYQGQYAFAAFVPGKYVVRFKYGDTEYTALPVVNAKAYNGQDYKSTIYQTGVNQNQTYDWISKENARVYTISGLNQDASNNETINLKTNPDNGYLYIRSDKNNISSAKDIGSNRQTINSYTKENVTNYLAEVLSGRGDKNILKSMTAMTAETGLMPIHVEDDKISDVNLGLVERPKAQLVVDKKVTNVKVVLANGQTLFDANTTAKNVLWKAKTGYSKNYDRNLLNSLSTIKDSNKSGLINLTMDEEIMHGATIEITYAITITNIGEVDYNDNKFYYTGEKSNMAQVVTTSAKVIDYVSNNLQFYKADETNSNWEIITNEGIKGLVNASLTEAVNKYTTKIIADKSSTYLVPDLYKQKVDKNATSSITIPLKLTQLITSENETDDLTYRNVVELVSTNNTVGRRMQYSIVGNQNPDNEPEEIDASISEEVKILPPFGETPNYIIISTIILIIAGIITSGVVLIKKMVLKNK